MSPDARSRLAAHAAAAGYPPDLLALIAQATIPTYQPGQQLERVAQVAEAVDVLAQAGFSTETVREQITRCQRRDGADWRELFWARALAIASVRYRHPERYGRSPCETDPGRLAREPAPPPAAQAA